MPAKRSGAKPSDFNFARRGETCLVSNDFSASAVIKARELNAFARGGRLSPASARTLSERGFFRESLDFEKLMPGHYAALLKDWAGPRVHIIAVTGACDHACLYCGASAGGSGAGMSLATAKKTVDFIFGTGSAELVLEFQGGEPLLNFGVLKHIVEKAKRLNRRAGKKLHFSVVTNLQGMDAAKLDFLARNKVSICASFDGVRAVHNKHRVSRSGSNYDRVERWLKEIRGRAAKGELEAPNAICTVTRDLLAFPVETVDAFVKNGLGRIQLGPLDPVGRGARLEPYPQAEYFSFYRKALAAGVKAMVFDRGGFAYHGRVKKAADTVREKGIKI